MARKKRNHQPGDRYHVVNRGVARRHVFEDRDDVEHFVRLLRVQVAEGRILVQAYVFMTTHLHLLVEVPEEGGDLAEAMKRVEGPYVQWFNARHGRDGPLFRGRYSASKVCTGTYWTNVVRYIDWNPVEARLAADPREFAYGSAKWYARAEGPEWLDRTLVEAVVRECSGKTEYDPQCYPDVFRWPPAGHSLRLVERRAATGFEDDGFDDLIACANPVVQSRLLERVRAADGSGGFASRLLDPEVIEACVGSEDVLVPLLRTACGLSYRDITCRVRVSVGRAHRLVEGHRARLLVDEQYAVAILEVLRRAGQVQFADGAPVAALHLFAR